MTKADLREAAAAAIASNVDERPHLCQLPHSQNFSSISLETEVPSAKLRARDFCAKKIFFARILRASSSRVTRDLASRFASARRSASPHRRAASSKRIRSSRRAPRTARFTRRRPSAFICARVQTPRPHRPRMLAAAARLRRPFVQLAGRPKSASRIERLQLAAIASIPRSLRSSKNDLRAPSPSLNSPEKRSHSPKWLPVDVSRRGCASGCGRRRTSQLIVPLNHEVKTTIESGRRQHAQIIASTNLHRRLTIRFLLQQNLAFA